MDSSNWSRLLAVLGVVLACSCWITAPMLFGTVMGENFTQDPAEAARIEASRQLWTTLLLSSWLGGLVAAGTIAGFTLRSHRILALLNLSILLAFIVCAVVWGS